MRGVKIKDRPHASRGGRPYPKEVREMVIQMMLLGGIATVKSQVVKQLRQQKKVPVLQTCRRWLRQHLMRGHILPKRKTGNKVATREITGEALVQLALIGSSDPTQGCTRLEPISPIDSRLLNPTPIRKYAEQKSGWVSPEKLHRRHPGGVLTQKSDET